MSASALSLQHSVEAPARTTSQEKEIQGMQIVMEKVKQSPFVELDFVEKKILSSP